MPRDLFLRASEETKNRYLALPGAGRECQPTLEGEAVYCFVDFETTGFDPERDRIIEVAAARVEGGRVVAELESLIDPGVPIPVPVTMLTGIDDAMVSGRPTMEEYFPRLEEFIGDLTVAAYSRLEEQFLKALYPAHAGRRFENPYLDVMDVAIMLLPSLWSHRQADLAAVWGLDAGSAHRAAEDVRVLAAVFDALLNGLYGVPVEFLKALADHAPRGGGLTRLLNRVLAERTGGRTVDRLHLERFVHKERYWEGVSPLAGRGHGSVTAEEVRRFFASDGALSRQFGDYEERDEQVEMAEAVRRALGEKRFLLVEAGTGTGKSLAYLLPAVLTSLARELPVVVSTRTLNLQDQLFTSDLPLIEAALGDGRFRYSVLKGYGNYLCLRKMQSLINGRKTLDEGQLGILGMLLNWVGEGCPGDVSLLNVSYLRGLNYMVLADHRDCAGERCPFARSGDCYYRKALYRAQRSHVVVVNHSLLLTGVNVPFVDAILDEAHTLEEAATEQFTRSVEYRETRRFLTFLFSPVDGSGLLSDLEARLGQHLDAGDADSLAPMLDEAKGLVEDCLEELERTFVALSQLHPRGEGGGVELRLKDAVTDSVEYMRLASEAEAMERALDALALSLTRLAAAVEDKAGEAGALEYAPGDLRGNALRLSEMRADLETVLSGEGEGMVRWANVSPASDFERQSLNASPIDVGPELEERLYDDLESMVMTSATLTTGGSFDFFCSRTGLDLADPERVESLVLDSSFDYTRQMQILLLYDMPEPESKEYRRRLADVIGDAIRAAGGGALVLFTNRSLMFETHNILADRMRREALPLLCQGAGHSRRRLAEEFVDDPKASLFGTTSFWEGVDARGETLRLVVVTRIPFESPGRPVFEARSERVRNMGMSDFNQLSLPLAALRLKQGVGRLIRTRRDRGQVLLLDSRIGSKNYGKTLLRSLPGGRRRNVSLDEIGRAIADFQLGEDEPLL